MTDRIINDVEPPNLKGYLVVYTNGHSCEIDWDDTDLIHPTIEAARAYIADWFDDDVEDDYLICEIDAPLKVVAERLGKRTRGVKKKTLF